MYRNTSVAIDRAYTMWPAVIECRPYKHVQC